MSNEIENVDSTNNTEETVNQESDVEVVVETDNTETSSTEELEILRKENATLKAQKEHWKEKATKTTSEKEFVKPKPADTQVLSTKDVIALAKANIDDDDVEDVIEYARFKKIPVGEALKSSIVRATLSEKAEQRKTAQATSTGVQRKGVVKVSDDALSSKFAKGELPESDDDIVRMYQLRKGIIKK